MRKALKRTAVMALAMTLACGMVGCGGGNDSSGNDSSSSSTKMPKSEISVGVWDGGLRYNWAERWAEDFEKANVNRSFEDGKMGVDVTVTPSKAFLDDKCAETLTDYEADIVFNEQVNYYKFITNETAYNIDEWVTAPLTEFGETKSIEDKMSDWDKKYYGQDGGEYYGVPWNNSILAINYDIKLFEDNNFYYAATGEGDSDGFVTSIDTPRSLGPDGKTGIGDNGEDYTQDDGMPATYDDFFKLCDKMVDSGVTPFTWAGGFQKYVTQLLYTLAADFEGYDDMQMNYTFDGEEDGLISIDTATNVITRLEKTLINTDNGYLLRKQEGMYQALKFMERVITTTDDNNQLKYINGSDCFGESVSHLNAQYKFLGGTLPGGTPVAMFIDGTWWYNEAYVAFNEMSALPGYGHYDRRIGLMPMPKATKDMVGQDATWMSVFITTCTVNANIGEYSEDKIALIREFFRYIHTDKALTSYLYDAHSMRPYTFELTDFEESDFSTYAIQQYNIYNKSKVVQPYSSHYKIRYYLNDWHNNFESYVDGKGSYSYITTAFNAGVTAEEYFEGMVALMNKTKWDGMIIGADV
ncbi:MAG: hypothetical protein J6A63_01570 [Clostridia bacterium]|nr:hypothetical protein [Clostridia bacterium]